MLLSGRKLPRSPEPTEVPPNLRNSFENRLAPAKIRVFNSRRAQFFNSPRRSPTTLAQKSNRGASYLRESSKHAPSPGTTHTPAPVRTPTLTHARIRAHARICARSHTSAHGRTRPHASPPTRPHDHRRKNTPASPHTPPQQPTATKKRPPQSADARKPQ